MNLEPKYADGFEPSLCWYCHRRPATRAHWPGVLLCDRLICGLRGRHRLGMAGWTVNGGTGYRRRIAAYWRTGYEGHPFDYCDARPSKSP